MPREGDYGYGEYTPLKTEHFDSFIRMHLSICREVFGNRHYMEKQYRYFDLTAGPGVHEGNDQTAMKYAKAIRESTIPHDSWMIERDTATCEKLATALGPSPDFHFVNGDHRTSLLPAIFKSMPVQKDWRYLGLLYYDVTPCKEMFDTLRFLGDLSTRASMSRIDFLFYLSPADIKRMKDLDGILRLGDVVRGIIKKTWLIREPFGKHQWTFLFGSNWVDFPKYRRIGFHRLDSEEGKSIFNNVAFTRAEKKEAVGGLLPFS